MLVLANADDMKDMITDLVAFEVILLADDRVYELIKTKDLEILNLYHLSWDRKEAKGLMD